MPGRVNSLSLAFRRSALRRLFHDERSKPAGLAT